MAAASLQEGLDTCSSVIDGSGKLAKQTTREQNGRKRSVFADGTTDFIREAPQSARLRPTLPAARGLPRPQTAASLMLGSVMEARGAHEGLDACSSADGSSKL